MITDCPYCTQGCTRCAAGMKSNDNRSGFERAIDEHIADMNTADQQPDPLHTPGLDAGIPTG